MASMPPWGRHEPSRRLMATAASHKAFQITAYLSMLYSTAASHVRTHDAHSPSRPSPCGGRASGTSVLKAHQHLSCVLKACRHLSFNSFNTLGRASGPRKAQMLAGSMRLTGPATPPLTQQRLEGLRPANACTGRASRLLGTQQRGSVPAASTQQAARHRPPRQRQRQRPQQQRQPWRAGSRAVQAPLEARHTATCSCCRHTAAWRSLALGSSCCRFFGGFAWLAALQWNKHMVCVTCCG